MFQQSVRYHRGKQETAKNVGVWEKYIWGRDDPGGGRLWKEDLNILCNWV